MTSRHTLTYADEIYAGNAFLQGTVDGATVGSPDGRRGIQKKHTYVREYGAVDTTDDDGILASYTSSDTASEAAGVNLLPLASGVYLLAITTVGTTQLIMDVPRNLTYMCTSAGGVKINIEGLDEYGQTMVESILSTADDATYSSGMKAFKVIDKIYGTIACTSARSVGAGPRLGLPYHLSNLGRFMGYTVDGMYPSGGATELVLVTGNPLATVQGTSSEDNPDVRGTFNPVIAPDGTKLFTAVMLVDPSTRNKAYGVLQATAIT